MTRDGTYGQRLAEQHGGLVTALAAKLVKQLPPQLELDDLIAWGTQGLLEAAERFDPQRGVAFSTFAHYRIQGAMIDGLRRNAPLSRKMHQRVRLAEHANDYLAHAAAREEGTPPEARAARTTADTLGQLSQHVAALTTVFVTSLDSLPEAQQEIADPEAEEAFDRAELAVLRPHLSAALQTLEERERRLVELCYYGDHSLRAAGEALGLSRSWASRLHARAIHKLQRYFARRSRGLSPPATAPP